jgi:hypothetical protein
LTELPRYVLPRAADRPEIDEDDLRVARIDAHRDDAPFRDVRPLAEHEPLPAWRAVRRGSREAHFEDERAQ